MIHGMIKYRGSTKGAVTRERDVEASHMRRKLSFGWVLASSASGVTGCWCFFWDFGIV